MLTRSWKLGVVLHPHARAFSAERARIDKAFGTDKVSRPIGKPLRVILAADNAVDGRAPGTLANAECAPFAHPVHELLTDAGSESAPLHSREPAAGDLLDLREGAAEVREVRLDN